MGFKGYSVMIKSSDKNTLMTVEYGDSGSPLPRVGDFIDIHDNLFVVKKIVHLYYPNAIVIRVEVENC